MKIAIPVDGQSLESNASQNFGRAAYFLIYDTETKKANFINNTAAASQGGAGIKAAQIIIDNKISVLLAPRLGENAAEVFKGANIKLYQTKVGTAQENIDAFTAKELPLLEEIHAGFHHGGR